MRLVLLFLILPLFTWADSNSAVVATYYENYAQYRPGINQRPPFSLSMIETDLITDLYYAFAGLGYVTKSVNPENPHFTGDFTIQPTQAQDESVLYPQALKLKQSARGSLKLFLCVGGWNFNDSNDPEGTGSFTYKLFSQMVSKAENRKQFIDSAVEYLHRFGFDGLDIDWEYPGDITRGGNPEDFSNFVTFLTECKTAFERTNPPLLLSYSAPAFVPVGLPQAYRDAPQKFFRWLAECAEHLDRINIMAYDYHGPFDRPKITGANSPLSRDTKSESTLFIAETLRNYLNNGVPADKMVLALPAFGHSYAQVLHLSENDSGPGKPFETPGAPGPATHLAGFLAYFEIADMLAQKKLFLGADKITSTAFAYQIADQKWVSFDTPETIKLKAQMAQDKRLKGIALWAIDLDEYYWQPRFPNLRSASKVFKS